VNAINDYVMPTISLTWIGTGQTILYGTMLFTGGGFTNLPLDCQVDFVIQQII